MHGFLVQCYVCSLSEVNWLVYIRDLMPSEKQTLY